MKPSTPHATDDCRRISDLLGLIGDKWSVLVLGQLSHGTVRFNELQRRIGGISQKMLSSTLRALERDGIVTRTVFPTVPPRVDYNLTDLGRDLLRPVKGLEDWARANREAVEAARSRFDGRGSQAA